MLGVRGAYSALEEFFDGRMRGRPSRVTWINVFMKIVLHFKPNGPKGKLNTEEFGPQIVESGSLIGAINIEKEPPKRVQIGPNP